MANFPKEVRVVFSKIKGHREAYEMEVNGIAITVLPDVFSPKYFLDSAWYAKKVSEIVKNKSLLEIGTGTGITALTAALNSSEVTCTDINESAVRNAQINFQRHGIEARILLGDIYEPLTEEDKFDYIIWNHPFNKGTNPNEEALLKAGFDFQYESLEKYIAEARDHLTEEGKLLLGTGNFADQTEIARLAKKHDYKITVLDKVILPLEQNGSFENELYLFKFVEE